MHGFVDFLPLFLLKGIFLYIEQLFWHTLKLQSGCNVCQENNDVVLSEAREGFRAFRLARRIEPDVQEALVRRHLLQYPKHVSCGHRGIRERFSPCLPLTASQQDRDRRPLRRFFHQNLFFLPITSKVSPSRI